MKVLYITHDGITDHIGMSQVAPYVLGLAAKGHEMHVLSAEKAGREKEIADYEARFAAAGVRWSRVPYHNSPPLVSTVFDLWRMWRAASEIIKDMGITSIHCRSYLPMLLGEALKRRHGTRLLFDFRDFWADAGLTKGRFAGIYRYFKRRERDFVLAADQIVCLTERAKEILSNRYPDPEASPKDKYIIIPCCADFDLFDPNRIGIDAANVRRRELNISDGSPVLLYLGSLGREYLISEMMDLFAQMISVDERSIFLVLANNGESEVFSAASAKGVSSESIRFRRASREDIPSYLAIADLSVVFYRPAFSRVACSPTKLGELFAMNVPVIANAGVGDLEEIISMRRNCSIVIDNFEPETLQSAIKSVLSVSDKDRQKIRANSYGFCLTEGVERYDFAYRRLQNLAKSIS